MGFKDIKISEINYNYDTLGFIKAEKILESIVVKFKYNKNLHGVFVIETKNEDMSIYEIKEKIIRELNRIEYDLEYKLIERELEDILLIRL